MTEAEEAVLRDALAQMKGLFTSNLRDAEQKMLVLFDMIATDKDVDQRWLAIGRTHMEQGFMAVHRALEKL